MSVCGNKLLRGLVSSVLVDVFEAIWKVLFLLDVSFLVHGARRAKLLGFYVCAKLEIQLNNLKYVLVLSIKGSSKNLE